MIAPPRHAIVILRIIIVLIIIVIPLIIALLPLVLILIQIVFFVGSVAAPFHGCAGQPSPLRRQPKRKEATAEV